MDVPIYPMYYQKEKNRYIVDKKVMYSELLAQYETKEEIAEAMKVRCNELGCYKDNEPLKNDEIESVAPSNAVPTVD